MVIHRTNFRFITTGASIEEEMQVHILGSVQQLFSLVNKCFLPLKESII